MSYIISHGMYFYGVISYGMNKSTTRKKSKTKGNLKADRKKKKKEIIYKGKSSYTYS